jgi:hypothetical protein
VPFASGHVVTADEYGAGPVAKFFYTGGSGPGSTTSETALSAWTSGSSGSVTWRNGHVYKCEIVSAWFDTVSEAALATIRLRKTVNSTGALQLGFFRASAPAIGASAVTQMSCLCFVKNVSGADIVSQPGLTVQRVTGTGTVTLFGDANLEMSVTISDMGLTTDTNLAAVVSQAVAIT